MTRVPPPAAAAALTAVLLGVAMIAAGELIPEVLVVVALFVGLAGALLRWRSRWLLRVAVALPLLVLVSSIPFVVSDLSHPESAAGFVPQLLVSLAALFTVVSAVATLREAHGSVGPAALMFVAVAVVGSAVSVVATATLTDDEAVADDVVVVADGSRFPAEVLVGAGGAGVLLDNDDPIRHTFVIEGTGVHQEMPGSTDRRLVVDLEPGTYRYYCDVPGHEGMEGTLVVE